MNEDFYLKEDNFNLMITLMIIVSVVLLLFVLIFSFLVYRLNSYSLEATELFLYLPSEPLSDLITNCEISSSLISSGNATETERKYALVRNEDPDITHHRHKRIRKYRNFSSFLKYSIALAMLIALIAAGYFVLSVVLEYIYRRSINKLLTSLDSSMRIESELQLSFNYEMECIHASTGMASGTDMATQGTRGCDKIREDGLQENYDILDKLETIEVYGDQSTSRIF
jgi:hypothetical protein